MKTRHPCPSCVTGYSSRAHDASGVPELLRCDTCGHVWHEARSLESVRRR